ncbi:hypothetical protein WN943_025729 [Citrus x changshan-huyou]
MLEVVIAALGRPKGSFQKPYLYSESNYAKAPLLWALSCNFIFIMSHLDLCDLACSYLLLVLLLNQWLIWTCLTSFVWTLVLFFFFFVMLV